MSVTAKVKVTWKVASGDGAQVTFGPDYQDDRNKEWAVATPSLNLEMTLKGEVADQFEPGDKFTLVFEKEE